jgi:hypothetical protein
MKNNLISYCILFLFFSVNLSAQDMTVSIKAGPLSFIEFAAEAQKQAGVRFIYKEDWVIDLSVSFTEGLKSIKSILDFYFKGKDLYYYIDPWKNVFITKGTRLITILPEYNFEDSIIQDEKAIGDNEATESEQRYARGRINGIIETITIGKKDNDAESPVVVVNGFITEKETGEPLIGATIYIEELERGYVTNTNGQFVISLPRGRYLAVFNCLGKKEVHYWLQVLSGGNLKIELQNKLYPIHEITISADQHGQVRSLQTGFNQLSVKSIKEIPAVMGELDVLKVVQMLPGIQSVGEGSAGINIRGSSADQNMFYINSVPVYNTSHLFGFFSVFNPDIIKDFSLYKSSLPAKFGGKLSSVIDITSRQGNKKKYTARGGISPITAHVAIEGPVIKDRSSFVFGARSTYSDWILSRMQYPDLRNSSGLFYDLCASYNATPDEKNLFKIFGYHSKDRVTLAAQNIYEYSNTGGSVNWWHRFSPAVSADFTAVFSQYENQHIDSSLIYEAYQHKYRITHYEFRNDHTWMPGKSNKMGFGGNIIFYDFNRGQVLPAGDLSTRKKVELGTEQGIEGAVYISDEVQLFSGLSLYGGLRYSFYGYLGPQTVYKYIPGNPRTDEYIFDTLNFKKGRFINSYSGPEARLVLNYQIGNSSSVKFSYSTMRQYLFMLSNTIAISPVDQWKLCDYHIGPSLSHQISAGYYKDFYNGNINILTELYYKFSGNIPEYKDGADFISKPNIETEVLQGSQNAYGMEILCKKKNGKLTGWIAMTYARSLIQVNGTNPWEDINAGKKYPSNYDIPFSFNGIINYRMNRRLSLSSNLIYHTGRPVTYPVNTFYIDNIKYIRYSSRNYYRIPDYFRADLSINLEGNLKARKVGHSYWMLSIYNITGRKNAYSVFFKVEDWKINGYRLSIFGRPIVTLSWNFKLGNYASE